MELPKKIQIGGQVLTTQLCEELGGKLGMCCCYNGYIKIATNVDGSAQTESSMLNTYIHECVRLSVKLSTCTSCNSYLGRWILISR